MKPPPSARLIRGHRLAQGLVGCRLFNEDGGLQVFDSSRNKFDGTIVGSVNWTSAKFGSALFFGGGDDDYVSFPATNKTMAPCSISLWFYWTGAGTTYILDHEEPRFTCYIGGDGKLDFYHDVAKGSANLTNVNTWYHIVLTFNADGYYKFYVNNIIEDEDDTNLTPADLFSGTIYLGTRFSTASSFDGIIDIPVFYNRVLSASEVAELYWKPFCMFERKARTALLSGYAVPPIGAAGIMTTNAGFWGPTF